VKDKFMTRFKIPSTFTAMCVTLLVTKVISAVAFRKWWCWILTTVRTVFFHETDVNTVGGGLPRTPTKRARLLKRWQGATSNVGLSPSLVGIFRGVLYQLGHPVTRLPLIGK